MFKLPKYLFNQRNETPEGRVAVAASAPNALTQSGSARLVFALDATMSREPTWDLAATLQGRMFESATALGGLEVQLVYFRGASECRASPFLADGRGLGRAMGRISVVSGRTQLGRVLLHARDEAARQRLAALVFIGDAVEEGLAPLRTTAGELALLGTKAFMFHEGQDRSAGAAFQEIARLTGGAYAPFDAASPDVLAALLGAVATYSAGGVKALQAMTARTRNREVLALLAQIR